jgi:hypothetical protein
MRNFHNDFIMNFPGKKGKQRLLTLFMFISLYKASGSSKEKCFIVSDGRRNCKKEERKNYKISSSILDYQRKTREESSTMEPTRSFRVSPSHSKAKSRNKKRRCILFISIIH